MNTPDRERQPGEFVRHSIRTYVVQLVVTALGLAMTVLTVRFLGPEGKGMLSLLILIPVLMVIIGRAGIGNSLIVHAPLTRPARLFFHALFLALGIGTGVSLLGAALVFGLRNKVFRGIPASWLAAMCVLSIVYFYYDLAPYFFLALRRIDLRNELSLLFPSAYLIFFVLFVIILKGQVKGAIAAWALAVLAPVLVSLVWITRRSVWRDRTLEWPLARRLLGFGLKSHLGAVMEVLNYRADFLIVSLYGGAVAVGLYACAVNMAEFVWKLPEALTIVLLPSAASLPAERARELTARVARVSLAIVLVLFLILVILRRPLILLLFGKPFLPSARPFLVLVPGFIAFSLWKILAYGLMAQGFPQKYSLTSFFSFLIMIGADFALIPRMGMVGAAWASTGAYVAATAAMLVFYVRATGTAWRKILIPLGADWSALWSVLKTRMGRTRSGPGGAGVSS